MAPTESLLFLASLVEDQLDQLDDEKGRQWQMTRASVRADNTSVDTEIYLTSLLPRNPQRRTIYVLSATLQYLYMVPRRALKVYLAGVKDILAASGTPPHVLSGIPLDPRTVTRNWFANPDYKSFIVCPSCHSLYPHDASIRTSASIPECTHRAAHDQPPCSSPLWKEVFHGGTRHLTPRLKYEHQTFSSWLARMISRPGMEALLQSYPTSLPKSHIATDIWQGDIFADVVDASGSPFLTGGGDEARLIFSLSMDSFDTHGAKPGELNTSSTGLWLVCYGLPPHLRYLNENIYLAGIIPGKPSLDEINPYIQLIVDDFKVLWTPGLRLSRTPLYPHGRTFKAMLIPLVCDMLGSRQAAGHPAPTAHNFCEACDLDIHDIDHFIPEDWPRRDCAHVRQIAIEYRSFNNTLEKRHHFEAFGQRWTPLLELPYWDPTKFIVIDSMHTLDINLLKHHLRCLFRIDVTKPGGDGLSTSPQRSIPDKFSIPKSVLAHKEPWKCKVLIANNPPDLLRKLCYFHRTVLFVFCSQFNISTGTGSALLGSRWVLAQLIHQWRTSGPREKIQELKDEVDSASVEVPRRKPAHAPRHRQRDFQPLWADGYTTDSSDLTDSSSGETQPDSPIAEPSQDNADDSGLPNDIIDGNALPSLPDGVSIRHIERLLSLASLRTDNIEQNFLRAVSVKTLENLCALLSVECPTSSGRSAVKAPMLRAILHKIDTDGASVDILQSFLEPIHSRIILGKEEMGAVWEDMERTFLPSWLSNVPQKWTSPSQLSADQARILLSNFMDLISAVRIANFREATAEQISVYDSCIRRYMSGVVQLYPDEPIMPHQHAALHIGEMLRSWGPVHSHSASYYERYIGFLHRININRKPGESELSFMNTAIRSANIRAFLDDHADLRNDIEHITQAMSTLSRENARDFFRTHDDDPYAAIKLGPTTSFGPLNIELFSLWADFVNSSSMVPPLVDNPSREVKFVDRVYYRGCVAFTHWDHQHPSVGPTGLSAGFITYIFQAQETSFVVIDTFLPVPAGCDPYRRYGFAGGYVCYEDGSFWMDMKTAFRGCMCCHFIDLH
ncbi:hypothetical protein ONZ45_g16182 [Pleurotus djamor]|nr:hypothetical protein ONZ45_g16182 [Pleurotus djamor]